MATTRVHEDQNLVQHVCENLATKCRVHPGSRLLIAVSGGSDSVALLHLLVEAAPSKQLQLYVAHFDHQLRPESAREAEFVRALAERLDVEPHMGSWNTPRPGEDAARQARHAFLQDTAVRLGCGAIALGHQRDDQIETTLLRLGRGSGPRGLLGMAWRRPARVDLVRPLLDCTRAALTEFLRQRQQVWCEDTSNQYQELRRNRIRHLALPALDSALGPAWQANWFAGLEDLRALWTWVDTSAAGLLEQARRQRLEPGTEICEKRPLQEAPEALRRAALQRWIESAGTDNLRRSHLEAASGLARNGQSGQTLVLPGAMRLVVERDRLFLLAPTTSKTTNATAFALHTEPVAVSFALRLAEACRASHIEDRDGSPPARIPSASAVVLGADRLEGELELRAAKPGERVRLLGAPGSRRLSRILQDKHIPARLRQAWPVIADTEGIVWIPEVGVAERCRLGAESRGALRLLLRNPTET